jgi:subtilisin family serine protease
MTCSGAAGRVCLVRRGNIPFADKVLACQNGGGVATIIYNDEPGSFLGTLAGTETAIPSVGVSAADGAAMLAQLGAPSTVGIATGDYAFADGTSMATPHVSGVAALVWNNAPGCSADDVRTAMAATAEDLGAPGRDSAYGFGLVQAESALALLSENCAAGGGDGGGGCELGLPGDACTTDADCCSDSCKGRKGAKVCR